MEESMNNENKLRPPDEFSFPFTPYVIQTNFMKALYETLEFGKLGIFESPTGTGKSLSIACAAIQWLKDHEARQIDMMTRKMQEHSVKQDCAGEDWIAEHYVNRLCREQKNNFQEQLDCINRRKEEIETIKLKKKSQIVAHKSYGEMITKNADFENEEEDDELIFDDTEYPSEEKPQQEELAKALPTQIIFCSRTHSQLSQMVKEISKSPHNDIRVVTLASRQSYCINKSVRNLKHQSAINEKCLELQKNKGTKVVKKDEHQKAIKKKKISVEKSCIYKNINNIENLRDNLISDIIDVEDLVKQGELLTACPYYASRISLEYGQFIALPYQTLLCKRAREISGVQIKNNIIIVDEAHNLLDTISSIHGAILPIMHLKYGIKILQSYHKKYGARLNAKNYLMFSQLIHVIKQFLKIFENVDGNISKIYKTEEFVSCGEFDNINLYPIIDFTEKNNFVQKIAGFAKKYPDELKETINVSKQSDKGVKAFLKQIANNSTDVEKNKGNSVDKLEVDKKNLSGSEESLKNDPTLSPANCLYSIISLLGRLTNKCDDGRIIVNKGKTDSQRFIKYLLLNPGAHFQQIVKEARSIVVAGGTMQPFADFRLQLFGESECHRITEFSCGHVVSPDNLCPIIIGKGPSGKNLCFDFTNRNNPSMMKEFSMIIQNICNVTPGGVVCFFPSYNYEQAVYEFLQNNNILENIAKKKIIFREPRNSNDVDELLRKYAKSINDTKNAQPSSNNKLTGALMLGVVGGKISEGLNFSDDLGRCVIVVGMPFPNKTDVELTEKINYLNTVVGNNAGNIYYKNLCFKAVNQCIGRAIRHINDYAAIVLIDERYSNTSNYSKLSGWIQSSLKYPNSFGQCQAMLSAFFNKKRLKM